MTDQSTGTTITAVERTAEVLRAFAHADTQTLGVTEVAQTLEAVEERAQLEAARRHAAFEGARRRRTRVALAAAAAAGSWPLGTTTLKEKPRGSRPSSRSRFSR